ncbi:MAG: hypothetical protein ABF381_10475, partial [Akkermansiaceae bacterium]
MARQTNLPVAGEDDPVLLMKRTIITDQRPSWIAQILLGSSRFFKHAAWRTKMPQTIPMRTASMAMIESIAMMKDMGLRALWLSFDQPQKIESSSTQSQSFLKTSLRNG